MIALLAALAATAGIDVGEKTPVALYLVTPTGAASEIPSATTLAAAERALARDPSLELWPMERTGVAAATLDKCPIDTRLSCWVAAMRPSKAAYLWALALQPRGDGTDRVRTIFIDLGAATARYRAELDGGAEDWRERAESALFALARRDKGRQIGGAEDLTAYFDGVVDEFLRPALEANGRWKPYGAIEVTSPIDDMTVSIDGNIAGVVRAGSTVIAGVEPGPRRVEAQVGDYSKRYEVVVVRSETARIQLERPPVEWHPVRMGALYAGGVVAASGIAILIWSIVRAGDGVQGGCLQRAGMSGSCDGLGALTLGYDPSRAPSTDPDAVDPSGIVMAPLGIGLMATGAAWSAGAWFGDREDAPWWAIAVGVATGIVVYGVGHVLE